MSKAIIIDSSNNFKTNVYILNDIHFEDFDNDMEFIDYINNYYSLDLPYDCQITEVDVRDDLNVKIM